MPHANASPRSGVRARVNHPFASCIVITVQRSQLSQLPLCLPLMCVSLLLMSKCGKLLVQ